MANAIYLGYLLYLLDTFTVAQAGPSSSPANKLWEGKAGKSIWWGRLACAGAQQYRCQENDYHNNPQKESADSQRMLCCSTHQ